jgi:Tfp pilus assembly protein PilO
MKKLQGELEKTRSRKSLLSEALPEKANVKPLIDDVRKAAEEQGIQLEKVIVNSVYLKESTTSVAGQPTQPGQVEQDTQTVNVQVTLTGSYDQTRKFILGLLKQRRIKSIKGFTTQNVEFLSKSAVPGLQLNLQIESYYL